MLVRKLEINSALFYIKTENLIEKTGFRAGFVLANFQVGSELDSNLNLIQQNWRGGASNCSLHG